MNVVLLDIKRKGDNKDYQAGFGTTFKIGNPSFLSKLLQIFRGRVENVPTLSYAYLSAIFKSHGHKVKYCLNEIPKTFDLALIHVTTIRHREEIELLKELKRNGLNNIGVYGTLASTRPELFPDADFIIKGEPESACLEMAKTELIPLGFVESDYISNLDILPFPDWSLFSYENFITPILPSKPFVFVQGSRGCPYKCSYCSYLVHGLYRERSPENVVAELKYLYTNYGIEGFFFRDPVFSLNKNRIDKLAHLIINEDLKIKWGCETRLDLLTKPLLHLMYKSGLRAIRVGIESVNHSLLKSYKRNPPSITHQEEIIKYCKKLGIKVLALYVIGLPGEEKKSIEQTIAYSKKLNTSFASFTICTPFPGTSFYDENKDKIFDFDLNHYDSFHLVFKHDKLTKDEIINLQKKALNGYYFRLNYVIRFLIDWWKCR